MGFTIPNAGASSPGSRDFALATVDTVDFLILAAGARRTGVASEADCAVSPTAPPSMGVDVAAGVVVLDGAAVSVAGATRALSAAHPSAPRFDLVCAGGVVTGTPSTNPVFPAPDADDVVLAAVWVVGGATAIGAGDIVDKRAVVGAPQAAAYRHVQAVPSATWTVAHGLGFRPNVTVVDSSGRVVEGEIAYPSTSTVVLTFTGAFSGEAYLS